MVAEEGCTSLSCIYSDKTDSHGDLIGLDFDAEKTLNKLTSIFKLSNVQINAKENSIYDYDIACLSFKVTACNLGSFRDVRVGAE